MTITDFRPSRGSNLDSHALEAVAAATGGWPRRPDSRRKTYVAVTGSTFHLRTYAGDSDDWFFGIHVNFWISGRFFVLVCSGLPEMYVLPVDDLLPYKWNVPIDYKDNVKLHIDGWGRHKVLREARSVRLDPYRNAFDLLAVSGNEFRTRAPSSNTPDDGKWITCPDISCGQRNLRTVVERPALHGKCWSCRRNL